jgi:hypothetical protein
MPDPAALDAVEARLNAILDPYRDRLEPFDIYGVAMLRRPGAGAHDWFAGVRRGPASVKLSLLPMHTHPEIVEGASAALLRHRSGASILTFAAIDPEQVRELEELVARAFRAYWPEPA